MALPSSGEISFSDISVELEGSSNQEISLSEAAEGSLVTLNTNSANMPDDSTPHSISEWYGYDHSAGGSLTEFNAGGAFPSIADACEVQDNGGTFYHNGSNTFPVNDDLIYEDDAGNSTAQGGVYFVNTGYILTVASSGKVTSITNCPR